MHVHVINAACVYDWPFVSWLTLCAAYSTCVCMYVRYAHTVFITTAACLDVRCFHFWVPSELRAHPVTGLFGRCVLRTCSSMYTPSQFDEWDLWECMEICEFVYLCTTTTLVVHPMDAPME